MYDANSENYTYIESSMAAEIKTQTSIMCITGLPVEKMIKRR